MNQKLIIKNSHDALKIAQKVINKEIIEILNENPNCIEINENNKGFVGNVIESCVFNIKTNSRKEADLVNINTEIKTTPLISLKNYKYSPKERLKLSSLSSNPDDLPNNFNESSLFKKNSEIILFWYLHNKDKMKSKIIDVIPISNFFKNYDENIYNQINEDYLKILNLLQNQKGNIISESDTKILGVARSGSGGIKEGKINQPFGGEKMYQRAFVLKNSFLKQFFALSITSNKYLNAYDLDMFKNKFLNKKVYQEGDYLGKTPKHAFWSSIRNRLKEYNILDILKEDFIIKTITINEKHVNVEHFKIMILNFQNQIEEEIKLNNIFQRDYLIFIGKRNNKEDLKNITLHSIVKINFSDQELEDLYKLFDKAYYEFEIGGNLNDNKGWDESKNSFFHLRPSDRNSKIENKILTKAGEAITKQAIWIDRKYIYEKIKSSL